MHTLTLSNNKIKEIVKLHQKKYRDESGFFIAEGFKSVEELYDSKFEISDIFALNTESYDFDNITYVNENTMKKISTTSSPCEILAVVKKKPVNNSDIIKYKKIALFENISDPGNLGTIIRSAAAFGVEAVVLLGNCVELYSPKVIRSCAGNFLKTPIFSFSDINNLKNILKDYIYISTSLSEKNNISFSGCKKLDKFIVMFGSEAKGLSDELLKHADYNLKLDMKNNVESLNLSVSASIIFYEIF